MLTDSRANIIVSKLALNSLGKIVWRSPSAHRTDYPKIYTNRKKGYQYLYVSSNKVPLNIIMKVLTYKGHTC